MLSISRRLFGSRRLCVAVSAALAASAPAIGLAAVPAPGTWALTFDDEFNGNSLDQMKWNYGFYGYSTSTHGLQDDSVEVSSNVAVGNGVLTFNGTNQGQWANNNWYNYSSGAVNTEGKLNFTYGYFEASQKMPSQQGAWPAFWTEQPSGWPPEIDVQEVPEFSGDESAYYATYHYGTYSYPAGAPSIGTGSYGTGINLSTSFNIYGCDWEPNSLTFYFNGNPIYTINGSQATISQLAQNYLILDLGIGGWPGEPASGSITTSNPAVMQTDWVRVWQHPSNTNNQVNWVGSNGGTLQWDDSGNWSGGVATQSNDLAYLGVLANNPATQTIDWSGSRTVNSFAISSPTNYVIGGSATAWDAASGPAIMLAPVDGVPSAAETVYINSYSSSGQGSTTFNARLEVPFSLLTLSINNGVTAPMTFNGDLIGPGNITFNGGSVVLNGNDTTTGNHVIANGATLTLNGQISAANEFLVSSGTVQANSSSAIVANAWMSVGATAGGTGRLNLAGGSITANTDFNIGDVSGSNGVMTMTGGTVACTNFYLGKTGTATGLLQQSAGSIGGLPGSGSDWRIGGTGSGSDSTAVGTYNLSGGTFSAPVNFQVGAYGRGIVNQTGGTVTVGDYLSIGRFAGSVGTYNMAAGSGTLTANSVPALIVGEQGTGTLLVGGTSHVNAQTLSIGHSDGANATGTVVQTGGTITATTAVEFGTAASGSAVVNGTYTLSGGTLVTPYVAQNPLSTVTGTFYFNGGTLQPTVAAPSLFQGVTNLRVQAGGAVISAAGLHLTIGQSLTHDPALGSTPDGGLTKTGFNTLTINAPQSYTGVTTISAGTLQLSPVPSLPDLGEVSDLDASTLALSNNANVVSLNDTSPVKNNAAVTVAGDYPTFNAASLNGKGTIHFNGSSQGLTTAADTGITGNSARTLFVIDRRAAGSAVNTHIGVPTTANDYGISDGNTNLYLPYSYNNDITTSPESATAWRLYTTVHNPSAATPDIGYVNGVQTTTGNLTLNTTNAPLQLGYRSGDGAQSDGDIAEVVVYNTALTAAQIQTVDQVLQYKWFGASLPAVSNLLPVTGTVNIPTAGAAFDLNGVNQTLASLNGVSGTFVTLGTATLTIADPAADTFNGSISGPGGVTKTAGGTLTLGGAGTYTGATNIFAGTLSISAGASLTGTPVTVAAGAAFNVTGSLSSTTPLTDNGTTTFTANSGATPLLRSVGAVTVGPAATLTVSPETNHAARQIISAASLSVNSTGTLNLADNDLDLTSASLQTITNLVASGYHLTGGGNWLGTGITSSTAAADTSHLTAIGVIQNNQNGSPIYSAANHFDTTTPGPADVLAKYTYFGDANLDGKVDGSDYSLIDAGYASQQPGSAGPALTGWLNGDFNYDGVVDGSDYALLDNSYNNQTTPYTGGSTALVATTTAQIASPSAVPTAVPEPATLTALIAAGALATARSRRQTRPA